MSEKEDFSPPWRLTGRGWMVLFRLKDSIRKNIPQTPSWLKDMEAGGWGTLIFADYTQANCGPYTEILFIPGKFKIAHKRLHSITKIYVSTQKSVDWGIKNWGIPKELARLEFEDRDRKTTGFLAETPEGKPFIEGSFRSFGPTFPVHSALLPFPVAQRTDQGILFTKWKSRGFARLGKMQIDAISEDLLPGIGMIKPVLTLCIHHFEMTFPHPEKLGD